MASGVEDYRAACPSCKCVVWWKVRQGQAVNHHSSAAYGGNVYSIECAHCDPGGVCPHALVTPIPRQDRRGSRGLFARVTHGKDDLGGMQDVR